MFSVIHGMQLDYFPTKEIAIAYYVCNNGLDNEGIVNILSLHKGNDNTVYVGAYGSPSDWKEYYYNERLKALVRVSRDILKTTNV